MPPRPGSVQIAALALMLVCQLAPSQTPAAWAKRPEEELLLFELVLDGVSLSTSFPGYALEDGGVIVPFGEFCRLVALGIKVDPEQNLAEGFIIQANRRFHLDQKTGLAVIGDKRHNLDPKRLEWHEDDLYVDTRLLAEWLPLTLEVDRLASGILIKPKETLPIQATWAREKNLGKSTYGYGERPPNAVTIQAPYALFELPVLDQTLTLNSLQKPAWKVEGRGTSYLAGDLLWMTHQLYFSLDPDGRTTNLRQTFSREDPGANLLGPLHARSFELGYTFTPSLDLLGSGRGGKGFAISSYPTNYRSKFDAKTFRGNLPLGWSVELYQERALVGYRTSRADGLYEFVDVPLRFGLNEIRLVFYGPEGQRREEIHRLDIASSQIPPGEFYYRASALSTQKGGQDYLVGADFGISSSLSVNAGLSRLNEDTLKTSSAYAGFQGFLPFLSFQGTVAANQGGGEAAQATLRTGWGFSSLSISQTEVHGFKSREFQRAEGDIQQRTQVRLQGNWTLWNRLPLQVALEDQRDQLDGDNLIRRGTFRASVSPRGWNFSNSLSWTRTSGARLGSTSQRLGEFQATHLIERFAVRGESAYQLLEGGGLKVDSYAATAEFRPNDRTLMLSSLARILATKENRATLSYTRMEGRIGLGVRLDYARSTGFSASLNASFSLAREPRTGRWALGAEPVAGQGAVSAMAFPDDNANGVMDGSERSLEKVRFQMNASDRPPLLEQGGVVLLGQGGRGQETYLSLDAQTLEDPYLKPKTDVYAFLPRPGKVVAVAFPLIQMGEVTGTLYLKERGKQRAFAGVELELVKVSGERQSRQTSAYDGFFDFTDIPPGLYFLNVGIDDAKRLRLKPSEPRAITIGPRGNVFDGLDLVVEREVPAPRPSPEGAKETAPTSPPSSRERPQP